MDSSPIIAQVWGTLGWVIPLMLLIGLLKSPWAKGHIGELLVRLFAHWQLDKQTYRRLHNVTLNTQTAPRRSTTYSSRLTASSCWKRRT